MRKVSYEGEGTRVFRIFAEEGQELRYEVTSPSVGLAEILHLRLGLKALLEILSGKGMAARNIACVIGAGRIQFTYSQDWLTKWRRRKGCELSEFAKAQAEKRARKGDTFTVDYGTDAREFTLRVSVIRSATGEVVEVYDLFHTGSGQFWIFPGEGVEFGVGAFGEPDRDGVYLAALSLKDGLGLATAR